jgi:rSAM/selenodomain-associated transferase 2/rSAM/selenodomain-associated transferase 1
MSTHNHCNHLLIFARVPQLGANKTRLIPAIGADKATLVYRLLTERTLSSARQLVEEQMCHATVHFTGGTPGQAQAEFGQELVYCQQIGSSLGERLQLATKSAFDLGGAKVVVIGTDCPSLTSNDLKDAFEALDTNDVVIGPAVDGGYYLIGLNNRHSSLFDGIEWSTSLVFEQTIQKAQALDLRTHVLRWLPDVDYPEDLLAMRQSNERTAFPIKTQPGRLSVVIPTLNEAANLPATLRAIGAVQSDLEVIVVDAGSTDHTVDIARQLGCQVFVGNPGRAQQMNAGAAVATGEVLLFLHADTRLPSGYQQEIRRVLTSAVTCGAFPLKIDGPGLALRMVEMGVALRTQIMHMPYGDQGLFFRACDFYEQGGFRQMSIMEDFELIDRMRKLGRIGLARHPVTTSARRWNKRGVLKTTIINQLCVLGYRLGYSDRTLAKLYHQESSSL